MTWQASAQGKCCLLLPEKLLSHHRQHKQLHRPGTCSCLITHSGAYDLTRSCTTQGPAPALLPTQAHVAAQLPAQAGGLLLHYNYSGTFDIKRTFTGQLHAPALLAPQPPLTSQAPHKPGFPSYPIDYLDTSHIRSSCSSHVLLLPYILLLSLIHI